MRKAGARRSNGFLRGRAFWVGWASRPPRSHGTGETPVPPKLPEGSTLARPKQVLSPHSAPQIATNSTANSTIHTTPRKCQYIAQYHTP
ncbi:hypothetical protein RAS1_16580 [Phycisphaerae bacterium RAS1]|nr:hypothetical protein RAS1_16580 [Phycisphaerae bacterium RAS1]